MVRLLARVAFLLSGVAGLTFEIVWLRHLGLAVGATTLAVATTTAAYMGGLALGSHIGGRIADRVRRPLAVYGSLEIGIALVGLAIPWLCTFIPSVDAALLADSSSGLPRAIVRFFVAAAVLILPTTAMGMTLPILARAVAERVGQVGREVGLLYALNIAGAMIGAAIAGFVLLPTIGLLATNVTAVGIDVTLGVVAIVAGLALPAVRVASHETRAQAPILRPSTRPLVAVLAVTGAAAMSLQVLWTRALGTALGPSTYAFTAIVCAYLAGLAIGGGGAAWISDQVRAVRLTLAAVLTYTGLATLFGTAIVDDLPMLLHGVVLNEDLTMGGLLRTEFALAALSVLPATIGMGAIFPITLAAVVGADASLGQAVGRAYAVNTLGNIAGSFGAVFVLLPLVGVEWGMRLVALSYVLVAGWLLLRVEPAGADRRRNVVFVAAAGSLVLVTCWPAWSVGNWTAGIFRMSMTRHYYPDGDFESPQVIFHKDGLSTTVTVEQEGTARWIKVNGKIDGSSEGDMPTQVLSGLLPLLFHTNPRRIAVIGCGSGVTVGSTLAADPESVTLIEIEGAVIEAARLFEEVNRAPWEDPRVTIVEDDGRNFMRRERSTYDVIISEPSNPWMTGAASLFTKEFFEIAAARLEPNGVFLQWLQIYELAPDRIASMLRTLNSVFPSMLVFSAHTDSNDLLVLGAREPFQIDSYDLEQRFEAMAAELERAELRTAEELLALLLFTDEQIGELPDDLPLNTDDNALIEFGAPRDLLYFAETDPQPPLLESTRGRRGSMVQRLLVEQSQGSSRLASLARGYLRHGMLPDAVAAAQNVMAASGASPASREEAAAVVEMARLFEEDDLEMVVDGATMKSDPNYRRLVQLIQQEEEEMALDLFESTPDLRSKSGAYSLLYGFLLYRDGEFGLARRALLRARQAEGLEAHRTAIAYYLAKGSFEDGNYVRALEEMAQYREASENLSSSLPAE